MSRIEPIRPEALSVPAREALEQTVAMMGYAPNDALTMAHIPEVMQAVLGLAQAVYAPGKVDPGLKRLIGLVTSGAAGCRYCMGHTAFASESHGVDSAKLDDVWEFETSPEFTDAEGAALRVAWHAGMVPNAVTDEMFAELGEHYDATQQAEIVAVIAMFGFLNRWNATLAMDLEPQPKQSLARVAAEE